MIRRSTKPQFNAAWLAGVKTTTIRGAPWPVGVDIQLFNWSALPYRSPQVDVAVVHVLSAEPITIERTLMGNITYSIGGPDLWRSEGFNSREEMDEWFGQFVPRGEVDVGGGLKVDGSRAVQFLMRLRLVGK